MLNSKKNGIGLKILLPFINELWEVEKPHHWAGLAVIAYRKI